MVVGTHRYDQEEGGAVEERGNPFVGDQRAFAKKEKDIKERNAQVKSALAVLHVAQSAHPDESTREYSGVLSAEATSSA
jgi:hypothetical protein